MPRTYEPEITAPCALVDARGRLNRAAIGWSRKPLLDCRLRGHALRKKRWVYWAVLAERQMFAITIADVDYLGLVAVSLLDMRTESLHERVSVTPFGRGVELPDAVEGTHLRFARSNFHVETIDDADGTHLVARFRTRRGDEIDASVHVTRPAGHETLSVVVPWSPKRFQLTTKQTALPAAGTIRVNGEPIAIGDGAFATLDFGRGVWPHRTTWNWAIAAGLSRGRALGINLGGRWTRGTGMTENAFTLDGRLHKIGDDLTFEFDRDDLDRPWRIRDEKRRSVDLAFAPDHTRKIGVNAIVLGSALDHAIGTFNGYVVTNEGDRIAVDGLRGWAEEHRAKW